MPDAQARRSLLIAMPQGLGVNGVVSWGLRLAGAMARRGWNVAVAAHGEPPGHARVDHGMAPGVALVDLRHLPPIDAPGVPLGPVVAAYRDALEGLDWSASNPAIVLPSLEANCYAAFAALAATHADHLRVIGWQHSDNAFDPQLLQAYEPMLSDIACVSDHITTKLRDRLPWRSGDIHNVPYGVELGAPPEPRNPGPLRLIYPGRMEHEARRVGVLCTLAHILHERSVEHELLLVGDGPAAEEVDRRLAGLPNAHRQQGLSRERLRPLLASRDVLLLTSRYEGLNVAMLEAMASGVAPVVTRVDSGTPEAIDHGVTGLLIDAGYHEDEASIAERMADALQSLASDSDHLDRMRQAAYKRARNRYTIDVHGQTCERLFEHAIAAPPRWWPLDRPCTFTSSSGSVPGGSVPPDAAERAANAIAGIDGPIAIYGAGRHTLAIAGVLASANVVCVIDDDPKHHGRSMWGWPVVGVEKPPKNTAVLISSYMHSRSMADRCRDSGLRPIELY